MLEIVRYCLAMSRITPKTQRGATMVEYALIVGLISIIAIVALVAIGGDVGAIFDKANTELDKAKPAT